MREGTGGAGCKWAVSAFSAGFALDKLSPEHSSHSVSMVGWSPAHEGMAGVGVSRENASIPIPFP